MSVKALGALQFTDESWYCVASSNIIKHFKKHGFHFTNQTHSFESHDNENGIAWHKNGNWLHLHPDVLHAFVTPCSVAVGHQCFKKTLLELEVTRSFETLEPYCNTTWHHNP
jgi:hypothetical protein